ncbi:unnamed protein product [Nezara viridula]|uniref:Uncharacterized protein n=1 Tax=Nezara viridula TaxID=85310 RepID=A0A9P0ECM6_NEZVI|nr:unnamed protein product [Nezara viridula]
MYPKVSPIEGEQSSPLGECSKRKRKHSSNDKDEIDKTNQVKRKRKKGNEVIVPDIIHELKEDLDRELDIKAQRNNLTATNVKNMIKAVITDSEVLKMIDYSLDKSTERPVYDLKLTRAKTKELIGLDQNAIWNIPFTQKKFDIEALINQVMSEDSSDEEYEPQEDSDEDTKASENTVDEESILDDDYSECESPVKEIIQGSSNEYNSDENIWQRTRSKLCLSETPLGAIEQAFVPPDITTDMYNTHCDNQDWLNFLKETYYDGDQLENNDDENDPEYNVMVDEETEGIDSEELRMDRAVKVTKKELNELMSELFEYTEMLSSDEEEETRDDDAITSKSLDDVETPSTSSNTPVSLNGVEAEDEKWDICNSEYCQFTEKQNCLLQQQLQQHVQLLLQSFLLSFKHPSLPDSYASECRKRIMELKIFKSNAPVVGNYNIINLEPSIQLMNKWVEYLDNQENLTSMQRFMEVQFQKVVEYRKKKTVYLPALHPKLIELCLSSCAFMHPLYLPNGGFTGSCSLSKGFSVYEDQLLAMGMEEFSNLLGLLPDNKENLRKIVELICYYLVTAKPMSRVMDHIKSSRKSSKNNPIKEYFEKYKAPDVQHFVIIQQNLKKLREYPMDYFPQAWEKYFLSVSN